MKLKVILCLIGLTVSAQTLVNPGGGACLGRYTTTYPGAAQAFSTDWELPGGTDVINKAQYAPKVVGGFTKPVQTNDWWTSAIWDYYQGQYNRAFTGNLVALPWTARAIASGLQLQYKDNGTRAVTADDYIYNSATSELSVSLSKGTGTPQAATATNMAVPGGAGQGTQVKDYGDYHVTLTWNDAANTMGMDATITKGSPFVFFDNISASTNVVIRTSCGPMTIAYSSPAGNYRVTVCGRNYGIFFSAGTTIMDAPAGGTMWQMDEGHAAGENVPREFLRFTPPATNRYVVLAALPNNTNATFLEYELRAYAFITGTQASYTYNETTADVTTTFTTTTALKANAPAGSLNVPVHALFRHQFLNIDPATPLNTTLQYDGPRGAMSVRYGNFNTVMKHYGMLQHMPQYGSYTGAQLYNLINQKYLQTPAGTGLVQNTDDLYFWGKRMNEIAQLIPLARQVGHINAYNRFRTELRAYLADLFTVSTGEVIKTFYYDATWDMMVYYPGSFWSTDQSNDRHFHYGYIINAAAMLARYDDTFITEYGPMVEMLIKDVANWQRQTGGTGNGIFPYLRFFDAYEGHSWANGMATDDENYGNDQESTSEAINCWSAIAHWGEVTGNNTIRDAGIYLRTTEIAAAEQYWFDVDNAVFPNTTFTKNTIGILRGNGAEYRIFFGGNARQCIHAISWLPFGGSSLYLGLTQPAGANPANKVAEMLSNQIAPATAGAYYYDPNHFPDLVASYRALYDPVNAITMYNGLAANIDPMSGACCPYNFNGQAHPYQYFDGQHTSFTYHWVHTLDSLRNVQRITADYSKTHVFNNGCWYYVIDNDQTTPINVTFSDGRVINNIPADSVSVYRFCTLPLPVELVYFDGEKVNEQSVLTWATSSEYNSDYFEIQRSSDGVNFETIGTRDAAGFSSGIINYSFIDQSPLKGNNYYRLREYDSDKSFYQSHVVLLNYAGSSIVNLFPNPAKEELTLQLSALGGSRLQLEFIDVSGKVVFVKEILMEHDFAEQHLSLNGLAAGMYVITLKDQAGVTHSKFVKE
jgi:endoglucanase Acf2